MDLGINIADDLEQLKNNLNKYKNSKETFFIHAFGWQSFKYRFKIDFFRNCDSVYILRALILQGELNLWEDLICHKVFIFLENLILYGLSSVCGVPENKKLKLFYFWGKKILFHCLFINLLITMVVFFAKYLEGIFGPTDG